MHIVILAWLPVALASFPTCRIMSPRQSLLPLQTPTHFAAPEAVPSLPILAVSRWRRSTHCDARPGIARGTFEIGLGGQKEAQGPFLPACLSFRPTRPPFLSSIICP